MKIIVGNDFSEDVRDDRAWTGWWVQRLIWFAENGDVLILPESPDRDFFEYATHLLGVELPSLRIIVPPNAGAPPEALTAHRLRDPRLHESLRSAVAGQPLDSIVALWPDPAVADLAAAIGASHALAGGAFVSQDGGRLLNSKTVFRAIANGVGAPVPDGFVCASKESAFAAIARLLAANKLAMTKQDYLSGGRGNEILSPNEVFRPIGARRVVLASNDQAVRDYLDERWGALTNDGRNRIVVEEYFRDSRAYFAEFLIEEQQVTLTGTGEMLSAPFAIGQIMPAPGLPTSTLDAIVGGGRRICEPLRAMGYRGWLSADAIVTPHGDVYFTEYNGRVTGSTHVYGALGGRVIGPRYGRDRMILERVWPAGWSVDSFGTAARRLEQTGLAYDPDEKLGIILSNAYDAQYRGLMYCIVAADLDAAWDLDRKVKPLFAS